MNMQAELYHPVTLLLLAVAFGLLIAIIVLGYTVISAVDIYRERMKKTAATILLLSLAGATQAQAGTIVQGLSNTTLYLLISVVGVELLVILLLLQALRVLAGIHRKPKPVKVKAQKTINWFEKLNRTKSLDANTEAEADMGHDYDGIRELNNPTPPWWRWGFYFSIIFAGIYLWRYHISHAAPLQIEELAIAEKEAAAAKAEYLKNAANNIDENNVKLLTDAGDIEDGKKLFITNCAACHGQAGQGMVGPNLTDDYWLHGGKLPDVFKTIKYGVPEKGMKSWKDDFSPKQLAQLSSFIRSIRGSKPANPKEQQGVQDTGE